MLESQEEKIGADEEDEEIDDNRFSKPSQILTLEKEQI